MWKDVYILKLKNCLLEQLAFYTTQYYYPIANLFFRIMAKQIMPYVNGFLSLLRRLFHFGYMPFVIYLGMTNQGYPLEHPITLMSVLVPFAAPQ